MFGSGIGRVVLFIILLSHRENEESKLIASVLITVVLEVELYITSCKVRGKIEVFSFSAFKSRLK